MKISTTPRTWQEVKNHPAVDAVEIMGDEVKYWIYLTHGYSASNDPHNTHQGNGFTIRDAIEDTFPVVSCKCADCNERTK